MEVYEWIENVFNYILNENKIQNQDVTNPRPSVFLLNPIPKAPFHMLALCIQDLAPVGWSTNRCKQGIRE